MKVHLWRVLTVGVREASLVALLNRSMANHNNQYKGDVRNMRMKSRIGRVFLCCVLSVSGMLTVLSSYELYVVNAQPPPEGCHGCLGQYDCYTPLKCLAGCCPTDCSAYVNSCQ